jgi:diaminohydroxyphosphoribosylaminopyrimidine deaminase/5-amino-6-(5-phosphoribosylamino)uracil reductase
MIDRALELARQARLLCPPNPAVGCVLVSPDGQILGEGQTQRTGAAHAEIMALRTAQARGLAVAGATAFVTLEPCAHQGRTGPCCDALIQAGIGKVVASLEDPNPRVAGAGFARLRAAGIEVESGILSAEAERLTAPFRRLVTSGRPWVIAKWAMSLDGRIAAASGASNWISGEVSRNVVHELRGRMDAILVGIGTALADDPLLTARPPGRRVPLRVVVDSAARLPPGSRLVQTAREVPILVAVGPDAPEHRVATLRSLGCRIWRGGETDREARLASLLGHLGGQRLTNLLVEGGSGIFGSLRDGGLIDEAWAFVAPKLIGGERSPAAIGGEGARIVDKAQRIVVEAITPLGDDLLIRGLVMPTGA